MRLTFDLCETLEMMPRQYSGQVVIPEELRDVIVEEMRRLYALEEEVTGSNAPPKSGAAQPVYHVSGVVN